MFAKVIAIISGNSELNNRSTPVGMPLRTSEWYMLFRVQVKNRYDVY